jgi:hypothetical protein
VTKVVVSTGSLGVKFLRGSHVFDLSLRYRRMIYGQLPAGELLAQTS